MKQKINKRKKLSEKELKQVRRKELFKSLIPLAKSFGVWIAGVGIVAWDYTNHRWFSMVFVKMTTYLTYGLSKVLFIPVKLLGSSSGKIKTLEVNYDLIMISGYPMKIELECSAYHAYLAIVALVLFSSWGRKNKIIFGSLLFVILVLINSLRIVLLGVIGEKYPVFFNLIHDYVWNILMVIILWGMWEWVNNKLSSKV